MGTDQKYVYLILNETDITGSWDSPEEAVRDYFKAYDGEGVNLEDYSVSHKPGNCTIDEMVAKMFDPSSDYPVLVKLPVNPQKGEAWTLDR